MFKFIKAYPKRVFGDFALFCIAVLPVAVALYLDLNGYTKNSILRSGAIMAIFGAYLDFRTHEIQALRDRDNFHRLWGAFSTLLEGLANVDKDVKYVLREMSAVIEAGGIKPSIGSVDEIKDMVVSEKLKALKYLPIVPEEYYAYSSYVAFIGKSLVFIGALICAFGDLLVEQLGQFLSLLGYFFRL